MRNLRILWHALVAIGVVGALAVGGASLFTDAHARCLCPKIYAPVQCDHGKTYPNPCVAECHHATNCVPTGPL